MEMVEERKWQSVGVSVPKPILASIDAEYSTHKEKMSALAEYVATTIPNITWEDIAAVLYQWDQDRAVERVKQYLNTFHGELNLQVIKIMDLGKAVYAKQEFLPNPYIDALQSCVMERKSP